MLDLQRHPNHSFLSLTITTTIVGGLRHSSAQSLLNRRHGVYEDDQLFLYEFGRIVPSLLEESRSLSTPDE